MDIDESALLPLAKDMGLVDADATDLPRSLRSRVIATAQKIAQAQTPKGQPEPPLLLTVVVSRGEQEIHSTSFTIPHGATP